MRRNDREVKDVQQVLNIMSDCMVCRIALKDEEGLYIVPMNFGYVYEKNHLSLYFHSAKEGRKYRAFHQFPEVAFEMDSKHQLVESQSACTYSYYFQCVMGNGIMKEIDNVQEKKKALKCLMKHQAGKDFEFDEKAVQSVAVFKLDVSEFSCKKH